MIFVPQTEIGSKEWMEKELEPPKKTVKELLREDFEKKVRRCMDGAKELRCTYDSNAMHTKPWACRVCDCKNNVFDKNCMNINPVRFIQTVYPDYLDGGSDTVIRLPPKTSVKGPHNTGGMDWISCGDKKNHTLKITQMGGYKLIKLPEGVPSTITVAEGKFKGDTFVNRELWAKDVVDGRPFQITEDLANSAFGSMLKPLYLWHNDQPWTVFSIWKDDWTEEFEGADFFTSSFLPKMPPPEWGDKEALREWVSNAFDVTPTGGSVELKKDDHDNVILEYDSAPERILTIKHLCCLGSHEEAIETKKGEGIIGRFGEGIKQANVIFMRKNRWMKIEAVGYTYYPVWGWDKMAESYLVNTYRVKNKRKKGTKITILNVDEPDVLIEDTRKLYLHWRNDYQILFEDEHGNQILSEYTDDPVGSRCISVNGSRTQIINPQASGPFVLFNYNLHADEQEKEKLVDRDRKFADPSEIRTRAKYILRALGEKEYPLVKTICEEYNKSKGAPQDLQSYWSYLDEDKIPVWKKAADEVLRPRESEKIAIAYHEFKDENLRALGFRIIDWGTAGNSLLSRCGYKYSSDFAEAVGEPRPLERPHASEDEWRVFMEAKGHLAFLMKHYYHESEDYIDRIVSNKYYNMDGGITIADSFQGCEEAEDLEGIMGMYRGGNDRIYILRDALRNVASATGILIHEFIHKYFDERDETREFENLLTAVSGKAGERWSMIQTAIQTEYEKEQEPVLRKIITKTEMAIPVAEIIA